MYPGEIWDFLRDSIPIFTHPDESVPETEPQTADQAAGRDSGLNESKCQMPEPNKRKDNAQRRHKHRETHNKVGATNCACTFN